MFSLIMLFLEVEYVSISSYTR